MQLRNNKLQTRPALLSELCVMPTQLPSVMKLELVKLMIQLVLH